ncbi:MAG: hypothetical protein WBL48_12685, partial [Pseudolabrys sp.]
LAAMFPVTPGSESKFGWRPKGDFFTRLQWKINQLQLGLHFGTPCFAVYGWRACCRARSSPLKT